MLFGNPLLATLSGFHKRNPDGDFYRNLAYSKKGAFPVLKPSYSEFADQGSKNTRFLMNFEPFWRWFFSTKALVLDPSEKGAFRLGLGHSKARQKADRQPRESPFWGVPDPH